MTFSDLLHECTRLKLLAAIAKSRASRATGAEAEREKQKAERMMQQAYRLMEMPCD